MKNPQNLLAIALLLCAVPAFTQFCEFRYTNASQCTDVYNCPATGGLGYVRKTFMFPTVQCPINGTFCYVAHTDETYQKCLSVQKCNLCLDPNSPSSCEGCVPLTEDVMTQACNADQCFGLNYTSQGTQLPTNESMNSFCEFRYVNQSVCTDAFNCPATGGLGYVRKTFIFPTVQCPINETFCYIAHTDPSGLKCVDIEKCDSCTNSSEVGTCVGCVPLTPADYGLYRGCDATTCWGLNYSSNIPASSGSNGSGSGNSAGNSSGSGSGSGNGNGSVGTGNGNGNGGGLVVSSALTMASGMVISALATVIACLA